MIPFNVWFCKSNFVCQSEMIRGIIYTRTTYFIIKLIFFWWLDPPGYFYILSLVLTYKHIVNRSFYESTFFLSIFECCKFGVFSVYFLILVFNSIKINEVPFHHILYAFTLRDIIEVTWYYYWSLFLEKKLWLNFEINELLYLAQSFVTITFFCFKMSFSKNNVLTWIILCNEFSINKNMAWISIKLGHLSVNAQIFINLPKNSRSWNSIWLHT